MKQAVLLKISLIHTLCYKAGKQHTNFPIKQSLSEEEQNKQEYQCTPNTFVPQLKRGINCKEPKQ